MTKHTMLQETPDSLPTSACMHLCSPDPHDPDRQHSDTNTVGTLRTIALFKLKLTEQSKIPNITPPRHKGSCPHEPMYAFQGTHTHNRGEKTATRKSAQTWSTLSMWPDRKKIKRSSATHTKPLTLTNNMHNTPLYTTAPLCHTGKPSIHRQALLRGCSIMHCHQTSVT